jgi:hypothetical protein
MPQKAKLQVFFNTDNINTKLYNKLIWKYLYNNLGKHQYANFTNNWKIHIYPESRAHEDPHFHGQNGIGGVTGQGVVKLYLRDIATQSQDNFRRVYRENSVVISHELSHAMLIHKGYKWRVKLRRDDYSGHKAGTELNYSTAEVHDRHMEGRFWNMKFWWFDRKRFKFTRWSSRVLEGRDIIGIL